MNSKTILLTIITCLMMVFAGFGQETQNTTPEASHTSAYSQIEPKKDGIIRIGVVTAKTKLKQEASSQDMAELIRNRWYSFLEGPTVELIPLEARSPLQINVEAQQKECDFVLYSTVSQKTKSSFFGSFLRVAVPVLTSAVPAGVGGTTGSSIFQSIRQTVQEGAKDAAKNMANEAASKIRASDQVTLEFNLVKLDGASSVVTKSLKGKAKSDGEEVISPLIEQAAEQILEAAMKKS